jgi:hypothetical protein
MSHRKESYESPIESANSDDSVDSSYYSVDGSDGGSFYNGSEESSEWSSDDHDFYENLVDVTLQAREKNREKRLNDTLKRYRKPPLKRSKYMEKVFNAILDLSDEILSDWTHVALEAADNGYSNVNIFEYSKGDKFRGLPIVLLMVGPKNDPNFFEKNGMFSVIEEIRMELGEHRLRVSSKYIGKGKNVINIDWKGGLFNKE